MKKKILFFSYWYPNKYNEVFPVFTRKHAQAISLYNDVTVLSLSIVKGKKIFELNTNVIVDPKNVRTHQVYIESRFNKLIYFLLPLHYYILKRYIRKKIEISSFSILHSNILFPCAIVGAKLARHFGVRHVITEHWSRLDHFFRNNLYRRSGRVTLNTASALTCVSPVLEKMVKKYTHNALVHVVPNVIDKEEFYYAPEKAKVFTFVAAANWTPPKNPFYFLDALRELSAQKKIPPFEVCLIGNGSQLAEVKERGYPFPIRYTGILDAKALNKTLNTSHFFLHGSDFETFSTIIAEALMCGLPSVVSPVGIASQLINATNGYITDNTHQDWVKGIQSCYQKTYDGRTISAQVPTIFDPDAIGKRFAEIYDNLKN